MMDTVDLTPGSWVDDAHRAAIALLVAFYEGDEDGKESIGQTIEAEAVYVLCGMALQGLEDAARSVGVPDDEIPGKIREYLAGLLQTA